MIQPLGFIGPRHLDLVCKLNKSFHGLKQAPRAWFDKLYQSLVYFGFSSTKLDQSLFIQVTSDWFLFVLVYVDDILVTGSSRSAIESLVQKLNSLFALKDLSEVDYFLGIQVKRTENGIHLSQKKYVTDLPCKTKMQYAKCVSAPMTTEQKLTSYGSDTVENVQLYRSVLGAF